MRTNVHSRLGALEKLSGAADPFSHLADSELEEFVAFLSMCLSEPAAAEARWVGYEEQVRLKFKRAANLHRAGGLH